MKFIRKLILYLLIVFFSNEIFSADLADLRFGSNGINKRIVLDFSQDVKFKTSISEKKINIKFNNDIKKKTILKDNPFVKKLQFSEKNEISIYFKRQFFNPNIYLLKKRDNKFSRIVIDFQLKKIKKKIIVIDPGHGGKDSGAIGINKILEKDITLQVAVLLKKKFEKYQDFKVILTRDRDIYLKLRTRTKIAKKNNADIFISLHADYHKNKRTRGISLYTLSERASDKEAEALARRENKSDFIDSVQLYEDNHEVTNILIDLTKRETLNQSSFLANFLIKEFENDLNLLQRTHRFAGFAVLKSLDIPSILVEMGYLSNKFDSKLLTQKEYQNKLVDKIFKAINAYFNWKEKK